MGLPPGLGRRQLLLVRVRALPIVPFVCLVGERGRARMEKSWGDDSAIHWLGKLLVWGGRRPREDGLAIEWHVVAKGWEGPMRKVARKLFEDLLSNACVSLCTPTRTRATAQNAEMDMRGATKDISSGTGRRCINQRQPRQPARLPVPLFTRKEPAPRGGDLPAVTWWCSHPMRPRWCAPA